MLLNLVENNTASCYLNIRFRPLTSKHGKNFLKTQEKKSIHYDVVLKGKGVQEGWTYFKKEILKAQEEAVLPVCTKTQVGREDDRPG